MEQTIQMTVPIDYFAIMRERTAVLMNMKRVNLKLDWVHTYDLSQLSACCERTNSFMSGAAPKQTAMQKELIENPDFATYYTDLLQLFPEEPEVTEPKTEPVSRNRGYAGYFRYEPPMPRSRRTMMTDRFVTLLENCQVAGLDITAFPQSDVMETLELDMLLDGCRLTYLKQFAPLKLSEEDQWIIAMSLNNCIDVPLDLSDAQLVMLRKPFVGKCELFALTPFAVACSLLLEYPDLEVIAQFLYEMGIRESLGLDQYKLFSQNASEYRRRIISVFGGLDVDIAGNFMEFWARSGYPLRELQIMERRLANDMSVNLGTVFTNYAGYVNLLYGTKLKNLDLARAKKWQEELLLYAIVNNKKHFIRMVDDDPELFLSLPSNSILAVESLYREHLNLNELTKKNLADCIWMVGGKFYDNFLTPGRLYTFQEFRVLYNVNGQYASLYNRLTAERQDDRLLIIRQIIKRGLLKDSPSDSELDALAACLNTKPLDRWMQTDFAHIDGLTAQDAVRLLIHLDELRHLLPSFNTRLDLALALQNLESVSTVRTASELRSRIIEIDHDWATLAKEMDLPCEFQARYEANIIQFLCKNGAYIATQYLSALDDAQQKAFLRVVKAELMGQLDKLKYYDGDLQKELSLPLSEHTIRCWKENTSVSHGNMEAGEYDDFFSTMLLGVQPRRTCLSYIDGAYRDCLLSGFDSNKKVLYAKQDGKIVGRAFLRLTKGRPTAAQNDGKNAFTFVDVEHIGEVHREADPIDEQLVLFLERPYTSGIDQAAEIAVDDALIELACRKASMLGAVLVLSGSYSCAHTKGFAFTKFYIYISRSKAGAQYLDSLAGEATVNTEGSYKVNSFLVKSVAEESICSAVSSPR